MEFLPSNLVGGQLFAPSFVCASRSGICKSYLTDSENAELGLVSYFRGYISKSYHDTKMFSLFHSSGPVSLSGHSEVTSWELGPATVS